MAWIESHDGLEEHPKLLALAEAMSWSRFEASGRLHVFWKWCLKFATTGDLHKFSDAVIGRSVELNGEDARRFVKAMTSDQSCWIDRGRGPNGESIFRVHDWPEYTRYYIKDSLFRRRPELWAQVEKVYAIPIVRDLSANSPPTVGHTNQPTDQPTCTPITGARKDVEPPPNPPHDPQWPNRIKGIHGWYCEHMGSRQPLDSGREVQWMAWFRGGFEEDDFKRVLKYLRVEIDAGRRLPGALKLTNLLNVELFGDDLALSKQNFKSNANNQRIGIQSSDRNKGTANEGKASQYAGVGKVGRV